MLTDVELLERWRAGDAASGSALLQRQFDTLYRFFRTKVDGSALPELVQQTMLACVENRDRYRGEARFSTYVYAIARSVLVAHYRKGQREDAVFDPWRSSVEELGPRMSLAFLEREQHRLLVRALRALPVDQQILLELHYWETLSGPELADVLEVPEGTVRTRLRRAKQLLREALQHAEADPAASTEADLDRWVESLRDALAPGAR